MDTLPTVGYLAQPGLNMGSSNGTSEEVDRIWPRDLRVKGANELEESLKKEDTREIDTGEDIGKEELDKDYEKNKDVLRLITIRYLQKKFSNPDSAVPKSAFLERSINHVIPILKNFAILIFSIYQYYLLRQFDY